MVTTKQRPTVSAWKRKRKEWGVPLKKVIKVHRKKAREERNRGTTKTARNNHKVSINTYLSISILNVNGLNSLIKRHTVTEWV